jgi:hypothetical protein
VPSEKKFINTDWPLTWRALKCGHPSDCVDTDVLKDVLGQVRGTHCCAGDLRISVAVMA